MTDSWDEMRKAKEEQYFQKENEHALERLNERKSQKPRLSPITGKPMRQVTLMGTVIDKCEDSGGIWLDNGELEALIKASEAKEHGLFASLFKGLVSK
jgi:hypothetical protein